MINTNYPPKKIFICVPLLRVGTKEEMDADLEVAREACRKITAEGNLPLCPQLYTMQFLDGIEQVLDEQKLSEEFLIMSDELRYYGDYITEQMSHAIELAIKWHIPIVYGGNLSS